MTALIPFSTMQAAKAWRLASQSVGPTPTAHVSFPSSMKGRLTLVAQWIRMTQPSVGAPPWWIPLGVTSLDRTSMATVPLLVHSRAPPPPPLDSLKVLQICKVFKICSVLIMASFNVYFLKFCLNPPFRQGVWKFCWREMHGTVRVSSDPKG